MRPRPALDFETLVELYYQPVFTFAVKLCGKLDRALELTQHAFCLALDRQSYLGEPRKAKPWLFSILFREYLKEKRFEKNLASFSGPCNVPSQAGAAVSINSLMAKVRPVHPSPVVLFYVKDFSCSQIADYLGISMEAVLTRLSQGREVSNLARASSVWRRRQSLACARRASRAPEMLRLAA